MKHDGEWLREAALAAIASLTGAEGDLVLLDVEEEDRTAETESAMAFLGLPPREAGVWFRVSVSAYGKEVSLGVPGECEPLAAAVHLANVWQDEMAEISGGRAVPACMTGHPHPMSVVDDGVSAWWACPQDRAVPRRAIWPRDPVT